MDYIHEATTWGFPLRADIEIEELTILDIKELNDGSCNVNFEYLYNEDGFSKNDCTHILSGEVLINPHGIIIQKYLKETHRGVAAKKEFNLRF